ncbi:MAG: hypothetical protein H6765_00710 [Candidatus Peribacteria bacterium]|nr:MAG: hypothetical protein H6765_00710 [Candidatus Peribacteria bacterium]
MEQGYLAKSQYKRYKLQQAAASDDYGALREVLIRRFELESGQSAHPLPDLLIIDGGKGQLSVIRQLREDFPDFYKLSEHMSIMGIGKGKARQRKGKVAGQVEEALILDRQGNIMTHQLSLDAIDLLLRKARDEAHRFANAYRKLLLKKSHTDG